MSHPALLRRSLLAAALLAALPAAAAAEAKAPKIKFHFSGLVAGNSYTITLMEGARFVGATTPSGSVEKNAERLTFRVPKAPKGSDAPEIEEAIVESDVEISARKVVYQVELFGRTSVEIDLLGEVQTRGRPHQLNGVPFAFELPIPELPKGWVLRAPPCPADPATAKARVAAEHGGYRACRPEGPK